MANIYRPDWDEPREREGFRVRRARIGRQAGTRDLGASLWQIPPGEAAYPYHWHLAEEELVVVLDGSLALRTPSGWSRLERGDVVSFPVGEEGGHQLLNDGESPALVLAMSTQRPDVVIYPDSGKLGAFERRPEGGGLYELFRLEDAVGYWEGEEPPEPLPASGRNSTLGLSAQGASWRTARSCPRAGCFRACAWGARRAWSGASPAR